jgi:hypothetical protein
MRQNLQAFISNYQQKRIALGVIVSLILIYVVNNLPEHLMLTNFNSVIIGIMLISHDYIHRYSARSALITIALCSILAYILTPTKQLATYGTLTYLATACIDYYAFNTFYTNKRLFFCCAIFSNFSASALNSILFSFAMMGDESHIGLTYVLPAVAVLLLSAIILDKKNLKFGAAIVAFFCSAFVISYSHGVWTDMTAVPWLDFFHRVFGVNINETTLWLTDMLISSLYKIIPPAVVFIGFCGVRFYISQTPPQICKEDRF